MESDDGWSGRESGSDSEDLSENEIPVLSHFDLPGGKRLILTFNYLSERFSLNCFFAYESGSDSEDLRGNEDPVPNNPDLTGGKDFMLLN